MTQRYSSDSADDVSCFCGWNQSVPRRDRKRPSLVPILNYYLFIIGIQPLGRFGQRPELSQSTGIALVRCILGKFLGVVCHCFPP